MVFACVFSKPARKRLRPAPPCAGAVLARAPGSTHGARVSLRAIGSDARIQWLLDGRWIAETRGAHPFQRQFHVARRA